MPIDRGKSIGFGRYKDKSPVAAVKEAATATPGALRKLRTIFNNIEQSARAAKPVFDEIAAQGVGVAADWNSMLSSIANFMGDAPAEKAPEPPTEPHVIDAIVLSEEPFDPKPSQKRKGGR